jgi:LemA protein
MRASVLLILVPAGFTAYGGLIYYRLLWLRMQSRTALRHIDELSGHHATIPDLLLAVSEYIKHEAWIIEHVIDARSRLLAARSLEERILASTYLSHALNHLFVISKGCVELHRDDEAALIHMQVELAEQKIALAREYYNEVVHHYNEKIEQFPHRIFARLGGLRREAIFESLHPGSGSLAGAHF